MKLARQAKKVKRVKLVKSVKTSNLAKSAESAKSHKLDKLSTNFSKLKQVSNWRVAQQKAYKYLGRKHGKLYVSPNSRKKYCVLAPNNHLVSFGAVDYQDFTKHRDQQRRQNYLRRAGNIGGNWRKNKFSPNNLAMHILW
jgi:hypothetical protein